MKLPSSPRARTLLVGLLVGVPVLAWEVLGLAFEEQVAWSWSRLVWDLSGNTLFTFAAGMLAGHFFFPKTVCLHCGRRPYRTDFQSRSEFDTALMRYAESAPRYGHSTGKRHGRFPIWMALAFVLLSATAAADPDVMRCRTQCPARPASFTDRDVTCFDDCAAEANDAAWRDLAAANLRPKMQLLVAPRVCVSLPGHGCVFTVVVLIESPGEEWYCPKVTFTWSEGRTSSVQSDCPLYATLSDDERRWFRLSSRVVYGDGEHVISVVIAQGKNKALLTRNVIVR